MLSAPTSRAEQLIYQRRAQQQKVSSMQTKLKQQFHQQEFAKWQNKNKNIQISNQVKQKLNTMRQQAQFNLAIRRQQLAALLQQENAKYQAQIIASQQTPEQLRQRMAHRVKELKDQKQAARKQEVNSKLDRRFQQNADELRKVDQDLKQLRVAYERNIQMVERQNLLQNNYQEQILFAQLNKRDIKKKQQAEKIKQQQQKQKLNQRNAILAVQMELKKRKQQDEKLMSHHQKEMLRQQWQRQSELTKLKQLQNIQKQKEINKVIIQENQKIRLQKDIELQAERARDREMIQRIVSKERELAEYEKHLKEQERVQARRVLQGFRNKNQQLAAYEKQLDRLIQQQRVKRQKKQQEEWQKRQKARINLLYQVFDDRQKKVNEHKKERQIDLKQKELDKKQVQKRIKQYELQQDRRRQQQYERSKIQQNKLLQQISEKEERRRLILMQLQRQERQMQEAKSNYNQKIEERKRQGRQKLQDFKKSTRLF